MSAKVHFKYINALLLGIASWSLQQFVSQSRIDSVPAFSWSSELKMGFWLKLVKKLLVEFCHDFWWDGTSFHVVWFLQWFLLMRSCNVYLHWLGPVFKLARFTVEKMEEEIFLNCWPWMMYQRIMAFIFESIWECNRNVDWAVRDVLFLGEVFFIPAGWFKYHCSSTNEIAKLNCKKVCIKRWEQRYLRLSTMVIEYLAGLNREIYFCRDWLWSCALENLWYFEENDS